jgi:manganese efflux pump family protein
MRVMIKAVMTAGGLLTALLAALLAAGCAAPAERPAAAGPSGLGIDTLVAWLITASIGAYMLGRWIARGGLRRQRAAREGLAPAVVFTHFGLALTGLAVWIGYLVAGWPVLAWSAVGLLMLVAGLGICTVTLLTPYPGPPRPGPPRAGQAAAPGRVTDEVLDRALTDDVLAGQLVDDLLARVASGPARPAWSPSVRPAALVPVGHGVAALATFLLAVLTAVNS